jgi:tetratricopeptide (TPR) repeat protein
MKLLSSLVLVALSLPVLAQEAEKLFTQVSPSVVTVQILDEEQRIMGQGSGVVIAAGKIVTNCHVVRDANTIQVFQGGQSWSARWIQADLPRDICVLQADALKAPAVTLRKGNPPLIGERVFAVGNPLGFGLAVSAGLISGAGAIQGEQRLFSSAAQSPGSSGGGLFDGDGNLVGLTAATMTAGQNINIVLPSAWINELPKRATKPPLVPSDPEQEKDWFAEAEKLRKTENWAGLEMEARQWIAAEPKVGLAHHFLGAALLSSAKYPAAETELRRAIAMQPKNYLARVYLAMVLRSMGRNAEAETELAEAGKTAPAAWIVPDTKARWAAAEKNDAKARDLAYRATLLGSGEYAPWALLATSEGALGHHKEAVAASRVWLRLKPGDPNATSTLGNMLARTGEVDRAREILGNAGPVGTEALANAWITLGVKEFERQHVEDAESAYRKALAFDPKNTLALRNLAILQDKTGRMDEAMASHKQAIASRGDEAQSHRHLADLLVRRNDCKNAIPELERVLSLERDDVWGLVVLGRCQIDLGDAAAARKAYQRAVELESNNVDAWRGLGNARARLGELIDAETAYTKADQLKPNDPDTLLGLCVANGRQGKNEQALPFCERAIALRPSSGLAWSSIGYALIRLGRLDEAIKALETAVRLQPNVANPLINLGEARLRQQQFGNAIEALQRAVALAPNANDARLFLAQAYLGARQPELARPQFEALLPTMPNPSLALAGLVTVHLYAGRSSLALEYWNSLKMRDSAAAKMLRGKLIAVRIPGAMNLPE